MSSPDHVLWYRLSVEFYDHPKVLTLRVNERELFQRAICFSKQNLTDGFITRDTLRQLAKNQAVDICECIRKGRPLLEVVDDWIDTLCLARLLDTIDEQFFQVHDYLQWNPSREHVVAVQEKRKEAGRIGGQVKALKNKDSHSEGHSKMLANCQELAKQNSAQSSEFRVQSTKKEKDKSIVDQVSTKPSRPPILLDDEWLKAIKANPIYTGIDIDLQFRKASAWYPAHGRKLTRKAFTNWLIREMGNKPLQLGSSSGTYHKKVQL